MTGVTLIQQQEMMTTNRLWCSVVPVKHDIIEYSHV